VRAVLPIHLLAVHEADVGFIDQSRGLQRVIRFLSGHIPARQPAQMLIDDRHELIQRSGVTLPPGKQPTG
jgi:hypothetical protein